ncbi:hypothetical protein DPMN_096893 [Dreissena polymorpha]|uniref:Uncharacterized protein n=1 Tax=Dreissena polymorpha TaxID=45954 RepID=A0A9D4R5V1_DREPO|nr:hypothetical protein DPMN_096893 [Dreissena polymorpha]
MNLLYLQNTQKICVRQNGKVEVYEDQQMDRVSLEEINTITKCMLKTLHLDDNTYHLSIREHVIIFRQRTGNGRLNNKM